MNNGDKRGIKLDEEKDSNRNVGGNNGLLNIIGLMPAVCNLSRLCRKFVNYFRNLRAYSVKLRKNNA